MRIFLAKYLKFIVPALVVLVVVVVLGVYFLVMPKKDAGLRCVNLASDYMFSMPEDHLTDIDSSPGSIIVFNKHIESFNPHNYQELLDKEAIIIQSFPSLNKNDDLFEKYIKRSYQSGESGDVNISFEEINKNAVATVVIRDQDGRTREYIKIVNLRKPVILATSGPSEALNYVIKSIKNTDLKDKDISEIEDQIILIGTLIKSGMNNDLYSLFSKEMKEKIGETDFEIILEESRVIVQRNISLNGGLLDFDENTFSCKLIFVDPNNLPDRRAGALVLIKEGGQWLISKLDIPKDGKKESGGVEGALDLDQDAVKKLLESVDK